jgi:hypothetical protein
LQELPHMHFLPSRVLYQKLPATNSSHVCWPSLQGTLHAVLDKLVARLEALLARKPFTQLGGLQLDRDTRTLVSRQSIAGLHAEGASCSCRSVQKHGCFGTANLIPVPPLWVTVGSWMPH